MQSHEEIEKISSTSKTHNNKFAGTHSRNVFNENYITNKLEEPEQSHEEDGKNGLQNEFEINEIESDKGKSLNHNENPLKSQNVNEFMYSQQTSNVNVFENNQKEVKSEDLFKTVRSFLIDLQKYNRKSVVKNEFENTSRLSKKQSDKNNSQSDLQKLRMESKNVNLKRMYKVIMSKDVPKSNSDINLIMQYMQNTHFYNSQIFHQNVGKPNDKNVLAIIESNFAEMMNIMARRKRQEKMRLSMQTTRRNLSSAFKIKSSEQNIGLKDYGTDIFSDNFFKTERAKWAKYFATQEKSSVQQKLDEEKKEKEKQAAKKKENRRKMRQLRRRKCQEAMQRIISLYTAPRVTHRLREAQKRLAENAECIQPNFMCESPVFEDALEDIVEPTEDMADSFEDCISWRSCCSKCRCLQEEVQSDTALDKLHRMQEDIL